jgi:hypothetical protein
MRGTRKSVRILLFVLLATLVMVAVVFLLFWHPFHPPARPAAVPMTAKWDGGPDGGNWIECVPLKDTTSQFFCTVYEDHNGEILYKGIFSLPGRSTSLPELRELLGAYSGDYIYLRDGRKMVATVPFDSSTYDEMMRRQPPKGK